MLPHTSGVALGEPLNFLPHAPSEGTSTYPTLQGREEALPWSWISKSWGCGWYEQTSCSGMQEVWAFFPIPTIASLGCLFTSLSPWFGVSVPLPFNSKQWDWCNFDYNPSGWIAPVGSSTHTLTPGKALVKSEVTCSCQQPKAFVLSLRTSSPWQPSPSESQ